ncbi:hypothetical protein ACQ4PT_039083 [Festuca glaucescens]
MDAINPPLLPGETAPRGPAPTTASGSSAAVAAATEGLMVDAPPAAATVGKRKRLGQHVVPAPPAAAAPPAPAAPPTPAKRAKWPVNKAPAPAQKKAAPKKAAKKPAAAKMASLTALTAAMAKAPPASAAACKVVDESPAVDVAPDSFLVLAKGLWIADNRRYSSIEDYCSCCWPLSFAMDYTSDGDSELEAYGSGTYTLLLSGDIKVMNHEGLYRCPFCSDGKDDYKIYDLLQHALSVGAAHDQQAKEKVDHRALAKHLKNEQAKSLSPLLQPVVMDPQPPQCNGDELFVWPWVGIIVNMPSEYVGKGANQLKENFSCFHPVKVHHVYSEDRPTGNAILEFGKDFGGFRNAHIFESQFEKKGYGKMGWQEKESGGPEPFGWIAREDDYKAPGAIGDFLRKNGDLKTVHEIQKLQQRSVEHAQKIVAENKKLRLDLQSMRHELDARSKQLDELVAQTDCDLELEEQRYAMKSNHLMVAEEEHQKANDNFRKLIEQQKGQKETDLYKLNEELHMKHKLELEIKHLMEKLEVIKRTPGSENSESGKRKAVCEELCDDIKEINYTENYNQGLIEQEKKAVVEFQESQKMEVIREDDKKLQELKEEYGEEAYAAVTTALAELNEHSSSGSRVPFLEMSNHKEGRKANRKEIVQHVIQLSMASK